MQPSGGLQPPPPAGQPGYPAYPPAPVPGQYPAYPYDPRFGPPPQWGGFPYVPGPTKKSSDGTIIAVVVTVVVLVFLVPVIYVLFVGMTMGPPMNEAQRPTIVLQTGQWSGVSLNLTVSTVSGQPVSSARISFQVTSPNGTFYFNGVSGASLSVSGTTTNVTLFDMLDEGTVSAGDRINIEARPNGNAIHGSTFRVLLDADVLGTARIP